MNKNSLTRRNFVKSTALVSAGVLSTSAIFSCNPETTGSFANDPFLVFRGSDYRPSEGVAGLLFSQIGYETGWPVRVIVRLPKRNNLSGKARCKLIPVSGGKKIETNCIYWGELWKSHWWIAEFDPLQEPGEWNVEIQDKGQIVFQASGLKVASGILWDETLELAALDMLERRVHFTKVGAGWQDAGTLWVESPAQSAMVIALEELLMLHGDCLAQSFKDRLYKQIMVGCDYLVMLQEKAHELGFPAGSMSHDLHGHERDVLPNDAVKAVIALSRATALLPENNKDRMDRYNETSLKAFNWLTTTAKPLGDLGLSRFQRGLDEGTAIPGDEWQTRDLVSLCWASVEQFKTGNQVAKSHAIEFARQIMARQIPEEKPEGVFYGHFLEYQGMKHSEKSWIHGIVNNQFGADIGGIYPNYLMPLIEMLSLWSEHEDAGKWTQTLKQFTYGYLIPVCEQNPFLLIPQGIFGSEGPVWFCGTFHGTNAIYGFTAALALELANIFNEPKLKNIAYGNLQWLAGLNAGITKENLKACVIYSDDIPEGVALPASMMCGVGNRWAGTCFQTRGVICNGFSTGKQFVYDTEPKKINDGPFSLTDEDWIPHSAAWLTGLARLGMRHLSS
ncbi:MAG: hypothetical protein JXR41_09255 [Bacteroidales bacterium]|nr:hypothetical protein [Bacteroidales bacterium]